MKINLDLQGEQINLRSDDSITLAMALHELCFNALRHGVGESGTILVKSRVEETGRVLIQVIDDGTSSGPFAGGDGLDHHETSGQETDHSNESLAEISISANTSTAVASRAIQERATGLGLSLVRALVKRELHGEFTLEPRTGGGTIATIRLCGGDRKNSS